MSGDLSTSRSLHFGSRSNGPAFTTSGFARANAQLILSNTFDFNQLRDRDTFTRNAMSPPYTPLWKVGDTAYWPSPYSLDPIPIDLQRGLIPVGILASLSVLATFTLIIFISYRLATWKMHHSSFLGYNQYVLLVLNLLIADLQQSAAFLFSFHWLRLGRIMAPTVPCFGQAWLLHSGDISSGFFVLAIAVHTFLSAVRGKRIGHKTFAAWIAFIWAFTYFLTGIGLPFHGLVVTVSRGSWSSTNCHVIAGSISFAQEHGAGSRKRTRLNAWLFITFVSLSEDCLLVGELLTQWDDARGLSSSIWNGCDLSRNVLHPAQED